MEQGLLHLYWGDGKGKTTAAMGLALRALGSGKRVVIVQFLKGGNSGEIPLLAKLGAEVVYPERDMAIRLAHRLETSRAMDFVQLSEKLNISKLRVPEKIVGKTVAAVNLRAKFSCNIIAIENGGALMEAIDPGYVFRKGDILFVAGSKDGLNRMAEWGEKT